MRNLPRSKSYRVPKISPSRKAKCFQERQKSLSSQKNGLDIIEPLREGSERKPNFAGHYTIVTWGAGLGNFSIAVVDAQTGKIYFAPFESVSRAGFGFSSVEGKPEENPAFRLDSKLFAFTGCPGKEYEGCTDWDKDGFYLYSFNNGRFKKERFVKREVMENALKK